MPEHVGKHKIFKEVKKAKRVAQSKQGKHNIIARSRKRCVSSTPTSQRCVSQAITKQMASKTGKYKPTEGTKQGKARQSHDLEKQLWIQSIEVSKHTYV